MATNAELQDELKAKNAKIKKLEEQVEQLLIQKATLEDQSKPEQGLSGYVITTKSPVFSGVVCGIKFSNGRAVILDSPETPGIVNLLRSDFGYDVERVENLREKPEVAAQVGKSMVDILSNR